MKHALTSIFFAGLIFSVSAADDIVRGPVWSGTVRDTGRDANNTLAMKGVVVTLGQKKGYVCYDTDLVRLSMAWTGDFLEFGNTLTQIQWPPPPQVKGIPAFRTRAEPGWAKQNSFLDPRPRNQGPLPEDWAHYKGFYVSGDEVVISYTVGQAEVLEKPGIETFDGGTLFTRTFRVGVSKSPLSVALADFAGESAKKSVSQIVLKEKGKAFAVAIRGNPPGVVLQNEEGRISLKLPAAERAMTFQVCFWSGNEGETAHAEEALAKKVELQDLTALCRGGSARWTENIVTKGSLGSGNGPYLVDTITEPANNPYHIKTFFGGFDFLPDGRAAICTFHGDVWIVSGIDNTLEKLSWKRFATGLFQPLGLKVQDGMIYVLGRDQITRLHDLNKDGEADYYENFNNGCIVTPNYHEFALDLHTDSEGNFYYCKGAPWEPNVTAAHQGTMIKVSKDGKKFEVIATGFRAPNGMTVGPNNEVLVGDNQGHWMPSSKLNLIKKGGFYGMMPAAQRELKFKGEGGSTFSANPSDPKVRSDLKIAGWGNTAPIPAEYDQPICWVPYSVDNSSGGQTFVTSDRWGPFKGHALFQSYGKCTLFEVMMENVGGVDQAAMVQFPLKFDSGVMRARFSEKDGQLYMCGLRGWQTSATRDGGFYRVRFANKPVHMPVDFHVYENGVEITFSDDVKADSAASVENWTAQQWNLKYSGNYGSPEVSVRTPGKAGHDPVEIKNVRMKNARVLFLETEPLKPVDQLMIRCKILAGDGADMSCTIFSTIHKTGPAH